MTKILGTSLSNGRAAAQGPTTPVISVRKVDSEDIISVEGLHYSYGKFGVPSWDNHDHYKKINLECKPSIVLLAMQHGLILNDCVPNLYTGIANTLKEKLQDICVGEEGFARIFDAAPEDRPEVTLNLLQKHSGAPVDFYITMTAAAMLDAGCPEEALTPILALYDEVGYSRSCYVPDIGEKVSLHFAARNGHKRLLQLLLRLRGNEVNRQWNLAMGCPIHLAAEHDHGDVMQVLLDSPGIQVNLPGCDIRNPENHHCYLGFRPHDNEPSWWIPATPIRIAAGNGSANALKAMLEHPTMAQLVNDPIFTGEAWCFAVNRNHPECVSLLEGLGMKPDGEGGMLSLMLHRMSQGNNALNPTQQLCIGNLMAERKVESALSSSTDGNQKRQSEHYKKSIEQIWSGIKKRMAQQVEQAADRMANELLKEEELEKKSIESKKAKRKAKKAAKKAKDRDNNANDDVCDACSSHRASGSHEESPCISTPCVSLSSSSSAAAISTVYTNQQDDDPSATQGGTPWHSQSPSTCASSSQNDHAEQHEEDPQLVKTLLQTHVLSSEATPSRSMSGTPSSTTDDPSSKDAAASTNNKNSRETKASHAVPPKTLAERLGLKVPIPVFVPSPHPI